MSNVTLEQVAQLAEQLSEADQAALIRRLQTHAGTKDRAITRESLLAEHAWLVAAGAFEKPTSLRDKYAKPGLDLSFEELEANIHEATTEWEQELDEFYDD